MTQIPILLHASMASSRVLRARQCVYAKNFPVVRVNGCKTSLIRKPSTISFHSLSIYASGRFPVDGESFCNSSLRPKSPTLSRQFDRISRSFASRRRGGQKGKNNKNNNNVISNEELISQLVRNAGESSADKVTVRLVTDEGADTPSSVQIITLSEAIALSLDRELDLIGTNINGDPPVIRATQLSKLEYKHQQAQKKQQQSASNRKEKKAFRFKAGIETNDLERKLDRLKEFLSKGHDCDFTVFTRMRTFRKNPNAGTELVEQIRALLTDHGDMKRPPQPNETKTFYRVQYEPKK